MRRRNWIATKREAPYPQNANGQSFFLVFIGASVAIDKRFFTFSVEGNRKHTQFQNRQDTVFTLQLCKELPKTDWKTRRYRISKNSFHRNINCFNDNICKKQFPQSSYKTLSPKKPDVKMNEVQKNQPSLHIKNPRKQQLVASKIESLQN